MRRGVRTRLAPRRRPIRAAALTLGLFLLALAAAFGVHGLRFDRTAAPVGTAPSDGTALSGGGSTSGSPDHRGEDGVDGAEAGTVPPPPGPLAVAVDNAPAARPPAGLRQADVIYEVLAEGGVTRFLAVFVTQGADRVGPVRSARPYLVDLAWAHGAPLAHAGGSPAALAALRRRPALDLDEIGRVGGAYWREPGRRAPHNLFTDTRRLVAAARRG
ncbi:MAG: DUF3048 domain-containing protein, partial [Clostridia bacterium]|nr:DUF3048 domain-containing protein [Clostridia bacterium]